MTLKVADLFGVQVRFHYSWFVIFALITWSLAAGYLPSQYPDQPTSFYWTVGAISAASLFLSVLVHEISHSVVARESGVGVRRITLHFFGGVAEIEEEARSPGVELKMAAAGPLSSLALAVILMVLWRLALAGGLPLGIRATLRYASYINFMLTGFNLIPAFPMDGGRILRSLLWRRSGDLLSSTRTATRVSQAFSYLFMAFGLLEMMLYTVFSGMWIFVIGLFIKKSADASMNSTIISEALEGVRIEEIMTRDVHTVEPWITVQILVEYHFMRYKHGGFPVVSDGRLEGMVTDQDVRQVSRERWEKTKVDDIMKPAEELVTVTPREMATDALLKMSAREVGRLPVVEGDHLVGIITRSDITKAIRMRLQFKI